MKNTIKLFGMLLVVFGIFVALGSISASQVDLLQPAELVTYDEDVAVNGTLRANSAYVGEEGIGGVTFFNGSIVNVGATTPVTVADDLRVDGEIWRVEKGGANPVKVSDHLIPTITNTNNLGSTSKRWNNIYVRDGNFSRNLTVSGEVNLSGNLDVAGNITAGPNNVSMPIAYARFTAGGTRLSGTPNISANWNSTGSYFEITIDGETYNNSDYVAVASGVDFARFPYTSSNGSGKLIVRFVDVPSGTFGWASDFSILVYKP